MDIYDVLSVANIVLALVGLFLMVRLAVLHRAARAVYLIVVLFCGYSASIYAWILFCSPTIGIVTATLGRGGQTFLLIAVVMFGILLDR